MVHGIICFLFRSYYNHYWEHKWNLIWVCDCWSVHPEKLAAAGMIAGGKLQQGSLGNKRSIAWFSNSQLFPMGSGPRSDSVKRDSEISINSDPEYIMQLVSDVRKFADMLFHLKEAFISKGKLQFYCSLFKKNVVYIIIYDLIMVWIIESVLSYKFIIVFQNVYGWVYDYR